MTALGKLFRTTAFKLSAAYLVIFTLFAFFLLGYVAWNARQLIADQVAGTVQAEAQGLAEQYGVGRTAPAGGHDRAALGPAWLVALPAGVAARRERWPAISSDCPPGLLDRPGEREISYTQSDEGGSAPAAGAGAGLRSAGRLSLLVGRDLSEADRLRFVDPPCVRMVALARRGARAARRLVRDPQSAGPHRRHDGDDPPDHGGRPFRASRRSPAPTTNSIGLAGNLNAMLDRIEELMAGLKEVSDNIAHDLKTPLTRLRNGAEEALRGRGDPDRISAARWKARSRRPTTSSACSTRC